MNKPKIILENKYAKALIELLKMFSERIPEGKSVSIYLAGGMAVNLYTGERPTGDVDAEFNQRVNISDDLYVTIEEGGRERFIYFDRNYNSNFSLMHEDYIENSIEVGVNIDKIKLFVFSPVDLAISKVSRFQENDQDDIMSLIKKRLINKEEFLNKTKEALSYYIGRPENVLVNLEVLMKKFEIQLAEDGLNTDKQAVDELINQNLIKSKSGSEPS